MYRSSDRSLNRVYLVAVALAVLPVAIFLFVAHRVFQYQTEQRVLTQSSQSGKLIGKVLNGRLSENRAFIQSLALRSDLLAAWQQKRCSEIDKLLQPVEALRRDFSLIAIVDPHGTATCSIPADDAGSHQSYASRDWYKGVTREWKPYVSGAYPAADKSGYVVSIAVPLRDSSGAAVGIVFARQKLESIGEDVYALTQGADRNLLYLVDQNGQIIGYKDGKLTVISGYQPLLAAVNQPGHTGAERLTDHGEEYIVSYSPIPDIGWGIFLRIPVTAVSSAAWRLEKTLGVLGAVILLLAFGSAALAGLLYRRLRGTERRYQAEIERQNRILEERSAELQETNAALEAFSYSVSHDLRAPLRAIAGFGAILKEDQSERLDAGAREHLDRIIESAHRMDRLIMDLLAYAKLGRMKFTPRAVDLERAIRDAHQQLEADLQHARAQVRISGPFPKVLGEQSLITQAIANLMSNAVKFVPDGVPPRIDVTSEQRDSRVRLWVRDNGIGVRPEYADRIFRPFERLHNQEQYPGTGIGLAIVSKAVERMAGQVGVESAPGKGSDFWIELPVAPISNREAEVGSPA